MALNPELLLTEANKWQARAEEHRQAAEFCNEQAARFLGKLVADEYKPELRVVRNEGS